MIASRQRVPSVGPTDSKSYRNGKDITNPRDWYTLLSEKVRCRNGAIEYSHPDDNSFLPQLAHDLDLSYEAYKSSPRNGFNVRKPQVSKPRSASFKPTSMIKQSSSMQDLNILREKTVSTLTSFYNKEFPNFKRKTSHVTFLEVKEPDHHRSVSLPKLAPKKVPGVIAETSVVQNENLLHSHQETLEEWFSQMPDAATKKAKRQVMEQNIQENLKRKDHRSNAPLPNLSKPFKGNYDNFPIGYNELRSEQAEEPIILNRDIYRLQLQSQLRLNDGRPSILDKIDRKRPDYVPVSPVPPTKKEDPQLRNIQEIESNGEEDTSLDGIDQESDLGFDPKTCPLFIVSTKRDLPLEEDIQTKTFHQGYMFRQKRLKRLKNSTSKRVKENPHFILKSELGEKNEHNAIVLSFGEQQYCALSRQPRHIIESINRQKVEPKNVKNPSWMNQTENGDAISENHQITRTFMTGNLVDTGDKSQVQSDERKARIAKYKKLEVFSENKRNVYEQKSDDRLVHINFKKEIPRSHPPVFKLDPRCILKDDMDNVVKNENGNSDNNAVPMRIVKGVVIVGSAKK
ncbi:hypothetical protein SNE40_005698 [Patella caerulea]|uniref:Uncharacterized protein n=1 Tax=Patella caerulea TaxID=87958 RepID=A0AAN8K259_PATCE